MVKLLVFADSKNGRKLHRWLGIIVVLYVLMASISGIIHIIMANFYAPPPPVIPAGLVQLDKASLPLSAIIRKLPANATAVKGVNLRTIQGELWYQFIVDGERKPFYINAVSGKLKDMDEAYARQIAEAYLKPEARLTKTDYLIAFNEEYLNIFRMLPVYRFDAEGDKGERVYVSTITGSVALYLNHARAFGQYAFSYLHKLSFIHPHGLRDVIQTILVTGIILTTLLGTALFIVRFLRKK